MTFCQYNGSRHASVLWLVLNKGSVRSERNFGMFLFVCLRLDNAWWSRKMAAIRPCTLLSLRLSHGFYLRKWTFHQCLMPPSISLFISERFTRAMLHTPTRPNAFKSRASAWTNYKQCLSCEQWPALKPLIYYQILQWAHGGLIKPNTGTNDEACKYNNVHSLQICPAFSSFPSLCQL